MSLRTQLGILVTAVACLFSTCSTQPAYALSKEEREAAKAELKAIKAQAKEERDRVEDEKLMKRLEKAKADLAKLRGNAS